ncbi:MAG TPA: prepilin peptidase [Mycobacteriales bacterium]|jgi:leader peptidase (prepilin peptidase)/N-methyltransferase|nr:prepilin peptidase [Mycobacteriales bacterium]
MIVVACAVLGLLVGSFLNVVIWRVPRGESVVSPPSHCPGCDNPISPRDNVPVLSWLLLRGRCRHCGEPISARYPAVELLTAGVFAAMGARFGLSWALPAFLYLGAVSVALALIDLDHHRLPNALTLPSYPVGAVLLAGAAFAEADDPAHVLLRAALGMVILWVVYYLLWWLSRGKGIGFGDVRLSGVLGLYLAYLGWDVWFTGWMLTFFAGGLFGIALIVLRRATRKSKVPYGPFMIVGSLVAVWVGAWIADAYLGATVG